MSTPERIDNVELLQKRIIELAVRLGAAIAKAMDSRSEKDPTIHGLRRNSLAFLLRLEIGIERSHLATQKLELVVHGSKTRCTRSVTGAFTAFTMTTFSSLAAFTVAFAALAVAMFATFSTLTSAVFTTRFAA
jgi:hypothetical protein